MKDKRAETATGRLSSANLNLQNIPVPSTKTGREVRRAFVGTGAVATETVSFAVIKHAVAKQFEKMKAHPLFRVNLASAELPPDMRKAATGDKLWEAYLAAFPPGTNPVYRERADHDCSCCRHFIREMGGVVAVVDGFLVTLWDVEPTGTYYDAVAQALNALVRGAVIDNVFLSTESAVGTDKSFEQTTKLETEFVHGKPDHVGEVGDVKTWEHFHLRLPQASIVSKGGLGRRLSEFQSTHDVLKRGLEELTLDAVDTVLELIAQNSLYRGAEYKGLLEAFRQRKVAYGTSRSLGEAPTGAMYDHALNLFVWAEVGNGNQAVLRIRNTAIGTLLIDLSPSYYEANKDCGDELCMQRDTTHIHAPKELEDAVRKFETSIMAPSNYKRPTALVSKAMIAKAKEQIEALGLASALERRYAHIDDITINNVLFADRSTRLAPTSVFDELAARVPESYRNMDKVEEVSVEKFLSDMLPTARSLEVLVENRHAANMVSLIAPVDPGARPLFKWSNGFSWSYAGDVADSMKERVKKAGGSVTGDLCCRLAWDYTDDLDFHMLEPAKASTRVYAGPYRIFFGNRDRVSPCGGRLDVDANGGSGMMAEPVENIFYADKARMAEGTYELSVNNYSRQSDGVGFEVEVEFGGETLRFAYDKALRTGATVVVAKIAYTRKDGFKIVESLPESRASKTVWGVPTMTYRKVSAVMLSPNYWGVDTTNSDIERSLLGGIGNKHFFFMLDGCANDGSARPFFNEFLSSELEPHRKTMEMVGAKMRAEESGRQLSGLGFSSTRRDSLLVRVKGAFARVVKVVF